jgi:hypothetical protein
MSEREVCSRVLFISEVQVDECYVTGYMFSKTEIWYRFQKRVCGGAVPELRSMNYTV